MKTQELTVQKEIQEYKKQVSFVQEKANELQIVTTADMEMASDLLVSVGKVEKSITERKNAITRPLMEALASARDLFRGLETSYADAKKTIKQKMLDFSIAEEERITLEKTRVGARLERGTIKMDTAVKKLEGIGDAPTSFAGESSRTSLKTVTKVRVVDKSLIPVEYMEPDMVKIRDAVLKQKLLVPGVETYEEKSIVGSAR